jgi:hypothetical protein
MHRRIKIRQRQLAISMQSIPKSVIETVDLRKSYRIEQKHIGNIFVQQPEHTRS